MAEGDAKVTVSADASALERAMAAGKAAVRDFSATLTNSIGSAARDVTMSLGNVALAQGKISFAGQHTQVREFEAATARLAVASGRDLGGLRDSIEATGLAIGKRPAEVAAWAAGVGKLTYNLAGAAEGMKGIAGLAAATGRSAEDYRGLAVTLGTVGKVGGDTTHVLGVMAAQAEAMHTSGGIAAFADQIEALQDTIGRFAGKTEQDFTKVTALAAELGKGLSAGAAGRVQQQALGAVANDPLRWERYLGRKITDEHGQVNDPAKVLQEITEKTKRRYGRDAERVLQLNFGAETGAAMMHADFNAAAKAAGIAPSKSLEDKQKQYLGTDAGKRDVAGAELAVSSRELMGSSTLLGRAADALQRYAAAAPVTTTLLSTALGSAMGGFLSKGGKELATVMGTGSSGADGASKIMGAAGGLAMKLGAVSMAAGSLYLAFNEVNSTAQELYGSRDGWKSFLDDLKFKATGKTAVAGDNKGRQAYLAEEQRKLDLAHRKEASMYGPSMPTAEQFAKSRKLDPIFAGPAGPTGKERVAADVAALANIFREGVKGLKFEVKTRMDTPAEVTADGQKSPAAGGQTHG